MKRALVSGRHACDPPVFLSLLEDRLSDHACSWSTNGQPYTDTPSNPFQPFSLIASRLSLTSSARHAAVAQSGCSFGCARHHTISSVTHTPFCHAVGLV